MKMESLFNSVTAICRNEKSKVDRVSGLRATFDWKAECEAEKAIVVKREYPDSFEILLEIVDEAPCWEQNGGRCGIPIEVVSGHSE